MRANAPQLPGGGDGRSWNWLMHYGEISAINCGLLKAGADCSERYFKNKDGELSFLDEICTVYCSDVYETFFASPERNVLST